MSETPNVVIESPTARRILNTIVSYGALAIGLITAVDAATAAFDLSAYVAPVAAGIAFLAGVVGVSVTIPNIPKPAAEDEADGYDPAMVEPERAAEA